MHICHFLWNTISPLLKFYVSLCDWILQQRYTLPIEAVDTFRPRPSAAQLKEPKEEDYISPSMMPPEVRKRLQEEARKRQEEDDKEDAALAAAAAVAAAARGGTEAPDVKVIPEGE